MKNTSIKYSVLGLVLTLLCVQTWAQERPREPRSIDIAQLEERMRMEFSHHDADSNGFISQEEFEGVLRNRQSKSQQRPDSRKQGGDTKPTTKVNRGQERQSARGEDRRAIVEEASRRNAERESEKFNTVDRDGDGNVSREEFASRRQVLFAQRLNRDYVRLDTDENNAIDFNEFAAEHMDRLREMDVNGDNIVTPDELGSRGMRLREARRVNRSR